MKKLISLLTAIILSVTGALLLFTGCDRGGAGKTTEPLTEDTKTAEPASGESEDKEKAGGVLVVVFSATGTTRGVGEKIASLTGGALKEIIPARPYTAEDLEYNNPDSRATREQKDSSARPEIQNDIVLKGCKTLFLGYPIWWGDAPRIMSTFVETHDFTGMTVIPFCTSGSSDIGQSDDTLAKLAGTGEWLQGRRFSGSVSEEQLKQWTDSVTEKEMEQTLKLFIGDEEMTVSWENNESVAALKELVSAEPLKITMSAYGGFEQVGSLGKALPKNDRQTTTQSGDIVLYSGDQLVIFYGTNSWAYTKLGRITGKTDSELKDLLGGDSVTVTIEKGE